jgi:hypothetical protein
MPCTTGFSRRDFLRAVGAGAFVAGSGLLSAAELFAQEQGDRPPQADGVKVLNPRNRVPVSFIIDDSTCLVNLAYYKIPQLAEVYPDRYLQDWRKLPHEIPDAFVRKFGEWCREHGVKGKYSVVPYPSCVGCIDRYLPGWTRKELDESVALVRDFMAQDWDIHPEMVTHTFAIDTKTGRPYAERTERYLENNGFSVGMSTDQMTDYISYALRILKNVGLPCEGVTTPGGFGSRARPALAEGTLLALRDVYQAEIPHYFRDLFTDERSVAPIVQLASGLDTDDPKCVVHTIGCTGDWFGGWDGLEEGTVEKFITEDLQGGRMPQVIDRGEPAIMVCHWPGIYYNGEERGFRIFQEVVRRIHARNDNLHWMKLSEIARYWAAKELTRIDMAGGNVTLRGPYTCPDFTLELTIPAAHAPVVTVEGESLALDEVKDPLQLKAGTFARKEGKVLACFNLPQRKTATVSSKTAGT